MNKTIWDVIRENQTPAQAANIQPVDTEIKDTLSTMQKSMDINLSSIASLLKDFIMGHSEGTSQLWPITTSAKRLVQKTEGYSRRLFIQADPGNDKLIYLGLKFDVSSTKYIVALEAKDYFTFDNFTGELWAISESGTQDLTISEL